MTDMMGGTPTNAALAMLNRKGVEVVTGVNLPMLLKVPFIKGKTSKEAANFLVEYGRRNLAQPSEMLEAMKPEKSGKKD
jgi:PTS system mannose-specific IIA component